ncbi:MAG: hypothetical protein FWD61_06680 [Phycisphaerales bacterium]|nr:hypothetical protein [Phycisphaerales bacterium]
MRMAPPPPLSHTRRKSQRKRHPRGTIIAFFLVIVAVVVTSLITSMAISSGTGAQAAGITLKRDRAFYAAESGIQHATWKLRYDHWALNNYPAFTGSVGGASYSVSKLSSPGLSTIMIQSVGTVPGVTPPASVTITCTLSGGGYPLPTVALGGNFSGGGGNHVTGNMYVKGSVSQNGNFTVVGGDIYATGTVDSRISLQEGYAAHPNSSDVPDPPSVADLAAMLKADPSAVSTENVNNKMDFTQSSKGILVYNTGDPITNWKPSQVTGDGTLVVFGDVSIKDASAFVGHNVNLVVLGNLTVMPGAQFNMTGSMYVSGNITSQSQFSVNGVILCNGSLSTQGQGSDMAMCAPPWFDPRLTTLDAGEVTIGNFLGPIF